MKTTRIFKVTYLYDMFINGKTTDRNLTGYYKTVAIDAGDAITKTRLAECKPTKFKDGKKTKEAVYGNFRAMEVVLLAEA